MRFILVIFGKSNSMFAGTLKKVFGSRNDRLLKKLKKTAPLLSKRKKKKQTNHLRVKQLTIAHSEDTSGLREI